MKTLEEACTRFMAQKVSLQDLKLGMPSGEAKKELAALNEQYSDIIKEIAANPLCQALVIGMMIQIENGAEISIAFRSAFTYGVLVGMEMEKQDL